MIAFGKHPRDERFQKLARRIEELRRKDESAQEHRRQIGQRRTGAVQHLWHICSGFASHLNSYIEHDQLQLSPPGPPGDFPEDNHLQLLMNARGRILLLDIGAPANLVASDNFKKPYILEGEVRIFNQELLEEEHVEEHGIFFCPDEGPQGTWMYWNGRSYKSGRVDENYLASLLDQIL